MSSDAIMFDAVAHAYENLGADLFVRRQDIANGANERLESVSNPDFFIEEDTTLAGFIGKSFVNSTILQLAESGFAEKNDGGYTLGQLFSQATIFSHHAQFTVAFFKADPKILAIDIRDRDATKKLADSEAFSKIVNHDSSVWRLRGKLLLREVAVIGTILEMIAPWDKQMQFTRPARKAPPASIRPVLAGPVA